MSGASPFLVYLFILTCKTFFRVALPKAAPPAPSHRELGLVHRNFGELQIPGFWPPLKPLHQGADTCSCQLPAEGGTS